MSISASARLKDLVDCFRNLDEIVQSGQEAPKIVYPAREIKAGALLAGDLYDRHVVTHVEANGKGEIVIYHRRATGGTATHFAVDPAHELHAYWITERLIPDILPEVPQATFFGEPYQGDMIVSQSTRLTTSAAQLCCTYDGGSWLNLIQRATDPASWMHDPRQLRNVWYVYQPAGTLPYLYVDGQAYLAKAVDDLVPGDVVRAPGYACHEVVEVHEDLTLSQTSHLTVRIAAPSVYSEAQSFGRGDVGNLLISQHDSRTTYLPIETPASDRVTARRVAPGDMALYHGAGGRSDILRVTNVYQDFLHGALIVEGVNGFGYKVMTMSSPTSRTFTLMGKAWRESLLPARYGVAV